MSIPQTTIYADPHQVSDPAAEAAALAPVLAHAGRHAAEPADREQRLRLPGPHRRRRHRRHRWPSSTWPASTASRSRSASTRPVSWPSRCSARSAPTAAASAASSTSTTPSWRAGRASPSTQIDPYGHQIPGGRQEYQAPVAGQDLVLSIDEPLQYDAEQALAQAIVAAKAKDGIALLMNSKTGEILADAELTMPGPGNTEPPAVPGQRRHRSRRPGAAPPMPQPVEAPSATLVHPRLRAGLGQQAHHHLGRPQDRGHRAVGRVHHPGQLPGGRHHLPRRRGPRHRALDASPTSWPTRPTSAPSRSPSGWARTTSSSTSTTTGWARATDIDFPGESAGLLPTYWSGTSIADVPIGQGIAVTAIQMLAAYNAIANGGVYVPPKLVDATIDAQGREHLSAIRQPPPGGVAPPWPRR